jgi:hypothetical protein
MKEGESPLGKRPLHVPGQSLDDTINRLWDDRGLLYFALMTVFPTIALYEWARFASGAPPHPLIATIVAAVVTSYSIVGLLRLRKKTKGLRLGRDAERIVAEALDSLREQGCRIFHDVVADRFNVDHVVISKAGIFVVETKAVSKPPRPQGQPTVRVERGKITAGGADLGPGPLEEAKRHARWVRDLMRESTGKTLPVKPCIVFPGWSVEPMPKDERQVWVLNPGQLVGFIKNEPVHMREDDLHLAASHLSLYIRSPWVADDGGLAKKVLKERAKMKA